MNFISLGRGFADEFTVSDLAFAIYQGDIAKVEKIFFESETNKSDDMALYLALRVSRKDIFEFLVKNGIEIKENIYHQVLFEDPSFLNLLPKNLVASANAEASQAHFKLCIGLMENRLTTLEVEEFLKLGADPNALLWPGNWDWHPLQLACMYSTLEIVEVLLQAGSNPDHIGRDNRNPIRIILTRKDLTRREKFQALKLFRKYKSVPIPSFTLKDRFDLIVGGYVF